MIMNSQNFGYPVKHKRKIPFNPQINISKEIEELNIEIFKLEAELNRYILSALEYYELISDAFSSNIHYSTKLEGNPLTKKEVKRYTKGIIDGDQLKEYKDFSIQEVANHLIAYILKDFEAPWTLYQIQLIHSILMQGKKNTETGKFRTNRSVVESSEGQELFIPAPPEHIEEELQSLLDWLNSTGPSLYPVITGAIFFHEFESIHPFEDGNGRCGRTLFHIYLQYHGLSNSKLCFIEQNIVSESEKYYELLAKTDFSDDYQQLIYQFTSSVHQSYKDAVERYREKDLLGSDLDETAKRVLIKAKEYKNWFSLEHAKGWFENISDFVLRKRLNELVGRNALFEKGSTKNKRYQFADPLSEYFKKVEAEEISLKENIEDD